LRGSSSSRRAVRSEGQHALRGPPGFVPDTWIRGLGDLSGSVKKSEISLRKPSNSFEQCTGCGRGKNSHRTECMKERIAQPAERVEQGTSCAPGSQGRFIMPHDLNEWWLTCNCPAENELAAWTPRHSSALFSPCITESWTTIEKMVDT